MKPMTREATPVATAIITTFDNIDCFHFYDDQCEHDDGDDDGDVIIILALVK